MGSPSTDPSKEKEARFEPAARPSPVEVGATLDGKYKVERVLGEGGMGIVVAATHLELEHKVAIKVLLPEAMENPECVERFTREAKVAAKVVSPHVVRVQDVGKLANGAPYIVMEYLEGCNLHELLDVNGPLAVGDAAEYMLQACEALAEVHAAGIIHRDLKPANVYLTTRADGAPFIKLLDFGISKFSVTTKTLQPSITKTQAVMGSPGYMSPEQMKSTRDVDVRSDIWSLGAVLYEILTGRPAFEAETMPQLCSKIICDDPVRPAALRPDIPEKLDRAIMRCLNKRAEDRFSDVAEAARVLAEFAPPRAQGALGHIEALVAGAPQASARGPGLHDSKPLPPTKREIPATPIPRREADHARTAAAWDGDAPKRPKRRGGIMFGIVVFGILLGAAIGIFWGKIDFRAFARAFSSETPAATATATHASVPVAPLEVVTAETPPPLEPLASASASASASANANTQGAIVTPAPATAATSAADAAVAEPEALDAGAAASSEVVPEPVVLPPPPAPPHPSVVPTHHPVAQPKHPPHKPPRRRWP